jgi:transposase-like protein
MSRVRRFFNPEFKFQVVREVEAGATAAQVAQLHQLHPNLLAQWCTQYRRNPQRAFQKENLTQKCDDPRVGELEQMIGKLTMENQFLKKVLERLERHSKDRKQPSSSTR